MPKKKFYIWHGVLFRKIILIFAVLLFVPWAVYAFLPVSGIQVLVFLVIFLIFVGVLIDMGLTRPLLDLVHGVREVSAGNFKVRFNTGSKDELGELAFVFNEMVLRLKEEKEREALAAKLKTEFMSIAAHQLRTPLSSTKWILKMLLDGDMGRLSLKQREFMEKAYGANERMVALVNDFLDVTRIEEGRFGFEFASGDLGKLIEEILPSFKQQARIRNVELIYKPAKPPLRLIFDPQRIKIAFSNLLDNAIRYTPSRGSVTLSVVKKENIVEISVADTGVGIPKDQLERVFSKFFRGDNVVRLQTDGTGLGLYLTRNIIEKHGGKIWFESEEGRGTTFHFTIPAKKEETIFYDEEEHL